MLYSVITFNYHQIYPCPNDGAAILIIFIYAFPQSALLFLLLLLLLCQHLAAAAVFPHSLDYVFNISLLARRYSLLFVCKINSRRIMFAICRVHGTYLLPFEHTHELLIHVYTVIYNELIICTAR